MTDGTWLTATRAVRLVTAGLTVALVAVVVASAVGTGVAFSPANTGWEGTSGLSRVADDAGAATGTIVAADGYDRLDPAGTTVVVLAPTRGYDPDDVDRVRTFVADGGTLLVAEDFGPHANDLLAGVGATARVDGRLVRDERFSAESPALPVARDVRADRLTEGVDGLTLNYGSVVRPGEATALVSTSPFAYLDADRDGLLDDGEPLDAYAVVTAEPVGAGRVIVVSDPSVFVNAMQERSGNRQLVWNLAGDTDRFLVDVTHAESVAPLSAALAALQRDPALQLAVLGAGVALVAAWLVVPSLASAVRVAQRRWRARRHGAPSSPGSGSESGSRSPDGLSPTAARQRVSAAHPDWDPERVDRVVEAFLDRTGRVE